MLVIAVKMDSVEVKTATDTDAVAIRTLSAVDELVPKIRAAASKIAGTFQRAARRRRSAVNTIGQPAGRKRSISKDDNRRNGEWSSKRHARWPDCFRWFDVFRDSPRLQLNGLPESEPLEVVDAPDESPRTGFRLARRRK